MRPLKPFKVGEVTNADRGVRVPLMLDRDAGTFFAELNGEKVESPTLDELRRKARELSTSKAVEPLQWRQVINISIDLEPSGNDADAAAIQFRFERFERTTTQSGKILQRDHRHDDSSESRFHHELRKWELERDDDQIRIPYTDENWNALEVLKDELKAFFLKFSEFFTGQEQKVLAKAIRDLSGCSLECWKL